MRARILTALVALVFGLLGVGLAFVGQHLYQDHLNLHALVQIEAQRQDAIQKAQQAKQP